MAADIPPLIIPNNASEGDMLRRLMSIAPDGTSGHDVERYLTRSGFECQRTSTKLVCRLRRKLNFFQFEVWTFAFDLDQQDRIIRRRAARGYLAP
jgi:hypothetical protein